jgi:lipopolysaccharide export system protein LptA
VAAAPLLPGGPLPAALQALFTGPQGTLKADRIEAVLAETGSGLERLEGYTNVSLTLGGLADRRTATGARLTYHAEDEQYDMSGTALNPLKLVEACREITGKTLTFYKSAERIIVDGDRQIRTNTKSGAGAACTPPPASATAPAATPAPR